MVTAGNPSYVVRPYVAGDEHGIVALFNRVFAGEARVPRRDVAAWRWEFRDSPAGSQIMLGVDAATGQIIAQYAALVVRFCVAGAYDLVTQPVDSMVDPAWRASRAFLDTAKGYFAEFGNARHCFASYGFPNARALCIGRKHLGYLPAFAPVPALHANLFAAGRWQALATGTPPLSVLEVSRFGSEVDALWAANRAHYPFAIVRDAAYLNWRFAAAPTPHRLFLARDRAGNVRAAFVLRERWCADSIVALADYLAAPDDADALRAALCHGVQQARARGFGRVEAWLPSASPLSAMATHIGLESEPSPATMVTRFYRAPAPLAWYQANWYYTIGDSDTL